MSATRSAAPRLRLLQSQASAKRLLHASTSYATPGAASTSSASTTTETAGASSSSTRIISSLILSRPAVILREPTKFEKAYHDYNRQLSEALQQPFPKDFYFKKGSAAEKRFEEDQASSSHGFSAIAGAASGSSSKGKAGKAKETAPAPAPSSSSVEGEAESRPLPRTTEADSKNDVRSLERKLDRTLYLVVKQKSSKGAASWQFPAKALVNTKRENLHDVAPASVTEILGNKMDIWLVSNLPIGLYKPAEGADEKTYFLRGHVLAGNAELTKGAERQAEEFQWLTKEEIEKLMDGKYWSNVEELLDP
ncbi:Ribosomal protein L46 [Kalmanozyma brasiliensis GHG001]|uniref:Large ribosomal subunit protein mL46 n=1 Tax=Kalmanozyma brasiliensis (strain GHG001) TaxID=1365824 RepID=V5GQS9_KALBG|nr:Ribosomal protein L46 [Kalmanozyma brasiliensis GHG001]EST08307.1 Ribosomal protein L46 [Kalmanozyma brasiliensis GHG001]